MNMPEFGPEEAIEMIEDWHDKVIPEIVRFLGDDELHILENQDLRNAFFAGVEFAQIYYMDGKK